MNRLIGKEFRKNNYFVLYDFDDNIICYFDNFEELSKHLNYPCKYLVHQFNTYGSLINIVINQKMYKLFTTNELVENFLN